MQTANGIVRRHLCVHGRVQGVGYRAWAEREALRRGLEGFARNRRDGSVEMLLVGSSESVREMLEACRRGPPASHAWDIREGDADEALERLRRPGERFSVLPTA